MPPETGTRPDIPIGPSRSISTPWAISRCCTTPTERRPSTHGCRHCTPRLWWPCFESSRRTRRVLVTCRTNSYLTFHWHETMSQHDGTIRKETRFPESSSDPSDLILSGPHFFTGNPFNKTPRRECTQNSHYDVLDLTTLSEDYLPRTNYVPAGDPNEYDRRTPRVPWRESDDETPRKVTEYYRVVNREMVGSAAERTLITTIIPRGVAHVNTTVSSAFRKRRSLLGLRRPIHVHRP